LRPSIIGRAVLLRRAVLIGAVLAWLIIAPSFGPVLLDPWRIGAALAFGAGGIIALIISARRIVSLVVIALVIIALVVIALVVVPLIVKTLTIPALMILTLPVIPLVIVPLAVLGAAVILVARGALVLTTVLARLALAGFGGFNQACLVIADHFDHIMACDIGLIIAALIAVV